MLSTISPENYRTYMELTKSQRQEILENTVREYIEKGYKLVNKDTTRAFLKRRAGKSGLLKAFFGATEKVFLYVESTGDVSVSSVSE
jgi:hypothetical protein